MFVREGERTVVQFVSSASRYQIETALGAGGMGEVYRGVDTVLGRAVAIKFLTHHTSTQSISERIVQEARSASALSHPNVCTVYEVTESDGQPCIVMEYVEGQALSTIIPPDVGLPFETTVSYGIQIADALAHAHDAGIIHRDLKSANIIVTPQHRVKVLDFGLAVQDAGEGVDDETSTLDELQSASAQGTPGTLRYMAPEVLRGERADRQSDIWALGAVLYEMVSGKRPFNGKTPHEISAAILTQPPEPLPSRIPSGLRSIIQTCLTKERPRRYHSASEVRAALEALQLDLQAEGAAHSISRRGILLLAVVLLGAVIVALAMSTAAFMRREPVITTSSRPADVPAPPPPKHLAVLPQIAPGGSSAPEALTLPAVEDTIYRIGSINLPGVKVIAFPTVLGFHNGTVDPIVKAREELHAEFVATIKVSTHGGHLTFNATLADAADTTQMWGQRYEGIPDDMLDIEGLVAQQIVAEVMRRLSPDTKLTEAQSNILTKPPTQNYAAYRLYAQGRRFWYVPTPTPDAYKRSIAYYDRAIKIDPKFALAILGRADTLGGMAWEGWISPDTAYRATADALQQVERIAPDLGQAQYTRAALAWMERKWDVADQNYRAAIDANPSLVTNRRFYALYLVARQRMPEAIRVLKDTLDRDPQGFGTNLALATALYWSGEVDQAIGRLSAMIDSRPADPAAAVARDILADVYESKGMLRLAIMQRVQVLRMKGAFRDARQLQRDYETLGFHQAMRALYTRELEMASADSLGDAYVSPVYFALLNIHLDNFDRAFHFLEDAVQENAPWLGLARVDPAFAPIRSDPRFERLIQRYETPAVTAALH